MSHPRHVSDYEPLVPTRPARARRGGEEGVGPEDFAPPARALRGESAADRAASWPEADAPAGRVVLLKRGHATTFAFLFLFTAVLYFRPYEYLPVPSNIAFLVAAATLAVYLSTQLALEGTLTARLPEINLALLFCLAALASIPLAISRGDALAAFTDPFAKALLMFVVFVNVVRTTRRLKLMMALALAISCVLGASALADFRSGNFSVDGYRVAGRIGGMFGNPNDMALHLATTVPLALALALASRGATRKLVFAACALLFTCGVVVTYSRGGFLGLACALFVLAWKLGRRHRLAVCVVTLAGVALLFALAPGDYAGRVASIFGMGADTGSASRRADLFWRSVYTAVHNPVFGVGIGNFHIVSIGEQVSHNAYTQVASEMGVPAMIIYTLFIVVPLRALRRIERETFEARRAARTYYVAVGVQAALVAYMVSSFFASVAYQWYVYYLVGYAVALRRIHESGQAWAADAGGGAGAADARGRGDAEQAGRPAELEGAPDFSPARTG